MRVCERECAYFCVRDKENVCVRVSERDGVRMRACERASVCVIMCACVREKKSVFAERESVCVCVCARNGVCVRACVTKRVRVCARVCASKRECVREREGFKTSSAGAHGLGRARQQRDGRREQ